MLEPDSTQEVLDLKPIADAFKTGFDGGLGYTEDYMEDVDYNLLADLDA